MDESQETVFYKVGDFINRIEATKCDVALFFFAGHGCMVNMYDCLLCLDAERLNCYNGTNIANNSSIRLNELCEDMRVRGNQINILIIDAFRTVSRSGSTPADFGDNTHAPLQTFIAYSTSPGRTASDGFDHIHSPYTKALLNHIQEKDLSIENLFKRVRKEVCENANQLPWEQSCLIEDFCFNYGQNEPGYGLPYSIMALADKNFVATSEDGIKILALFKSLNYYKQEDALNKFKQKHKNLSADEKFVIGRNILQSAQGGCWACQNEIRYNTLSIYKTNGTNPVWDGILYEMYFDSNNDFRGERIKGVEFISNIAQLASHDIFKPSFEFIHDVLAPYLGYLPYIPGSQTIRSIRISVEKYMGEDKNPYINVWEIIALHIDGVDSTELFSNAANKGCYSKTDFLNFLSEKLSLPVANMKLNFSHTIEKKDIIVFSNKDNEN